LSEGGLAVQFVRNAWHDVKGCFMNMSET